MDSSCWTHLSNQHHLLFPHTHRDCSCKCRIGRQIDRPHMWPLDSYVLYVKNAVCVWACLKLLVHIIWAQQDYPPYLSLFLSHTFSLFYWNSAEQVKLNCSLTLPLIVLSKNITDSEKDRQVKRQTDSHCWERETQEEQEGERWQNGKKKREGLRERNEQKVDRWRHTCTHTQCHCFNCLLLHTLLAHSL